jgi:type IV secretory pathway VirB10-like protein
VAPARRSVAPALLGAAVVVAAVAGFLVLRGWTGAPVEAAPAANVAVAPPAVPAAVEPQTATPTGPPTATPTATEAAAAAPTPVPTESSTPNPNPTATPIAAEAAPPAKAGARPAPAPAAADERAGTKLGDAPEPKPAKAAAPPADAAAAARLLAQAERRYGTGDFAGAIADYRRSLAAKAGAPAFVGLARALYDSNRAAEALTTLDAAVKADARYAPAYLLIGEIHQGEDRVAQARAAYQRFLALQPGGEQADAVRQILATQLK